MAVIITKEHLQLAAQIGACSERRTAYRVGMDLSDVRCSDLAWMVERLGRHAAAFAVAVASDLIIFGSVPPELIGSGSGGSGYGGDGSGSGYGSGGDGSGSGYGSGGYGYGGDGSGSGGYGYGYGDGDGDGYGSGSGGYGYGYGYGDGDGITVCTSR